MLFYLQQCNNFFIINLKTVTVSHNFIHNLLFMINNYSKIFPKLEKKVIEYFGLKKNMFLYLLSETCFFKRNVNKFRVVMRGLTHILTSTHKKYHRSQIGSFRQPVFGNLFKKCLINILKLVSRQVISSIFTYCFFYNNFSERDQQNYD